MGLMRKLFGTAEQLSSAAGGELSHSISKDAALKGTDPNAVSHRNADFSSVRSAPIVTKPRYFSKQEADALAIMAKEKRQMADAAQKAYKSLKSIDTADTTIHQLHRGYQGKIAKNELDKLKSNTHLAEQLHALRPEYAQLGSRIDMADNNASNAIASIKASFGA